MDRTFFVYLDTSDKGSDQAARKRRLTAALAEHHSILYVPGDCYLHAFHSAVKDGLQLLDDLIPNLFEPKTLNGFTKYYGSLAKLTNLWREQAAEIMRQWDEYHQSLHNEKLASEGCAPETLAEDLRHLLSLGRRYPHQVVSGRWGSVESAEEFLQERGKNNVVPVLLRVLARSMKHGGTLADRFLPRLFEHMIHMTRIIVDCQFLPIVAPPRRCVQTCRFCFLGGLLGPTIAMVSLYYCGLPCLLPAGFRSN